MAGWLKTIFATGGDRSTIPDAAQPDGSISYQQGYPLPYSLNPATDPSAKRLERQKFNQLMYDITRAVQIMQAQGVADFITSAENNSTPYAYGAGAMCYLSGKIYQSKVAANTDTPPSDKWQEVNIANLISTMATRAGIQQAAYSMAAAAGTANAITAAFEPAITALTNGMTLFVRSAAANTTATPTFTPNSGTIPAKTIVKGNNNQLVAGDIAGAGHWLVMNFDTTLDKWVLQNPAVTQASDTRAGIVELATAAEAQALASAAVALTPARLADAFKGANQSLSANGYQKLPGGLIIQMGTFISSASADVAVTFPISFPTAVAEIIVTCQSSGTGAWGSYNAPTKNGFNGNAWAAAGTRQSGGACSYIAIGY